MNISDYGFGGKKHQKETVELYEYISELDFENGDYFCFKSGGDGDNGEFLMDLIDSYLDTKDRIHAIDEEPMRHGRWVTITRHEHYPSGKEYETDYCSECSWRGSIEYDYCPWCGAKMDKE